MNIIETIVLLVLTPCLLGDFASFFVVSDFFLKSTFSKNSFRNSIRMSNCLDPEQAQPFVRTGLSLGPYCLQRLSTFFQKLFPEFHQNVK